MSKKVHMPILHYCKNCSYTAIAARKDDVLYCSKCNIGERIASVFSTENERDIEELFDGIEINDPNAGYEDILKDLLKEKD